MQYRKFGKLDFNVSAFGFGCMRLPMKDGAIDEAEAIAMIRTAADQGVNYFDTAFPYHEGKSELLVAKALKDGYREKIKLATKLPSWLIRTAEDFDKYLDLQLQKLEVEYLDFYLLHALDTQRWEHLTKLGALEFLERAKKSGKIRHAGFSFHDELPVFKRIVDGWDWDMCQIQLNFIDVRYQAGVEGLRYAAARGIPVVVMEPLRGGSLTQNIPEDVARLWQQGTEGRSAAEWAFRWVCDFPEVVTVLSGVSSMRQLNDNLRIFDSALPSSLSKQEKATVEAVRQIYESRTKVGCTGCEYCMPCPQGVNIPEIFRVYNNASVFSRMEQGKKGYARLEADGAGASKCVECAACESACPQHIEIIQKLKEARAALG